MTWKIEFEKEAAKEFKSIDSSTAKRILSFLSRIEKIDVLVVDIHTMYRKETLGKT